MYPHRIVGTTAIAAVLALSGCGGGHQPVEEAVAAAPVTSTTQPPVAQASVLPAPEALADVLYRLSDPAVPGAEKLNLIEGTKPTDAATIDKFATALADGGYLPLNLQVADLGWSDRHPGNATADVTVTTANPDTGEFAFPMEFTPLEGGWQLSQETAKTLLAFGKAQTGSTAPEPAP